MEGGNNNNTFVELLKTVYELKTPEQHKHSQNRAVFVDLLSDIGCAVEQKDYKDAIKSLRQCIVFIRTEPNLLQFMITDQLFEAIEKLCCFCYYKLKENFTELRSLICNDTKLTMLMLTITYMEKKGQIADFIEINLIVLLEYLFENHFTCEKLLEVNGFKKKKGGVTKKNSKTTFNDVIKIMNNLKMPKKKDSNNKKAELGKKQNSKEEEKVVKEESTRVKTLENSTQTTNKPLNHSNACVQTDKQKHKNVCIQADMNEINDSQILSIVCDIRRSIKKTNKKEEEIDSLKKQLAEVQETFKKYKQQVAMENAEKQKSLEIQCAGLRITASQLEAEKKTNQEKFKAVKNILLSQLEFRRNLQNVIFNNYENKCRETLHFLKCVKKFVSQGLMLSIDEFHNFVRLWRDNLKHIETQKHQYMADFEEMEKSIRTDKTYRSLDWPNLHDPSSVELFTEFVNSTVQKHDEAVQKLKIGKNLKRQPPDTKRELSSSCSVASTFDSPQGSNKDLKKGPLKPIAQQSNAYEYQSHKPENRKEKLALSRKCSTIMGEKSLYIYLMEHTGLSEEVLCSVLTTMTMKNKTNSVCGQPKEEILKEVKKMICTNKPKNPWGGANNSHKNGNWRNEDTEKNCTICFEEYNDNNVYGLPCKYEFHKKCIQTWLKTSSCCPICRLHTPFEEDFPALRKT